MIKTKFLFLFGISLPIFVWGESGSDCSKQTVDLYLAQRSCIIDNDQKGCSQLGLLHLTMPSSALVSAGAGKIAAEAFNKLLSSRIGLTQAQKLIENLRGIDDAKFKIRDLLSKNKTDYATSQAEREIFGRQFKDYLERYGYIVKSSATITPINLDRFDELDPVGAKKSSELQSKFEDRAKKISLERIREIAKTNTNPVVTQMAQEIIKASASGGINLSQPFRDAEYLMESEAIKKAFGSDVAKEAEELMKTKYQKGEAAYQERYSKASSKAKLLADISENYRGIPESLTALANKYNFKKVSAKKAAAAGGVVGAIAPAALYFGGNIADESKLKSCSQELGLSPLEMKVFGSQSLGGAPAVSNTSDGLLNFSCEKLGFVNPAESIYGIMSLNNNEVPAGTCKIIKNELKRMNDLVGDSHDMPQVSCNSFSMANVKLAESDGKMTFTFNDGNLKYQAPWNSETSYPDLAQVKIFDSEGKENRSLSLKFVSKYNFMHPPNAAEKNPGYRDMASSCDKDSVLDCRLINAAVKAKIYSGISNSMCSETTPSGSSTKDPAKEIKAAK